MTLPSLVFSSAVACSQASTAEEILESLSEAFSGFGFAYFAAFEAFVADDRITLSPILGKAHEAWLDHYRASDLAKRDLRLRRARMSSRDFFCSEVLKHDSEVTDDERDFFRQAKAFNIGDSYVLPYRTAGGRVFATVLIGEGRPITSELRVGVRILSHEFLLSALSVHVGMVAPSPPVRLTPRQVQCLEWIRDGKSSNDIALMLNISARTVDHYVGDACAKLGVRSRAQAVALAISLNAVSPPTPR